MIVKTFELSKKENLNNSIFLLYGVNEGFKNQMIERYFIEGFKGNIERYEENEVLNNDDFISSLMNKSLGGTSTTSFLRLTALRCGQCHSRSRALRSFNCIQNIIIPSTFTNNL